MGGVCPPGADIYRRGYPPPPYSGDKILGHINLRRELRCKILSALKLFADSSAERSYGRFSGRSSSFVPHCDKDLCVSLTGSEPVMTTRDDGRASDAGALILNQDCATGTGNYLQGSAIRAGSPRRQSIFAGYPGLRSLAQTCPGLLSLPPYGRLRHGAFRGYMASGLSMPSQPRASTSSRSATAAVASRNIFRAGSSSVRM